MDDLLITPAGESFTAITDLRFTHSLTDCAQRVVGAACAASLECTLRNAPDIAPGTELTWVHRGEIQGIFLCDAPRHLGAHAVKLTAYDRMTRFDREVSGLTLPAAAGEVLSALCEICGVETAEDFVLPHSEEILPAIQAPNLSGRELLRWIGQWAGVCFVINPQGRLQALWYTPSDTVLGENLDYRLDSYQPAAYQTAPVERLWVRMTETDVGQVYPDGEQTANTYILQGNPFQPDPQRLLEVLGGFSYRPYSVSLFQPPPALGSILTLPGGDPGPVMERSLKNGIWSCAGAGEADWQSPAAYNTLRARDLTGRMLSVERSVSGLKVSHSDIRGNLAAVELDMDGITTRVTQVEAQSQTHAERSALTAHTSQLTQRSDSLEFSVTELRTQLGDKADQSQVSKLTEHFRFDMDGLTISNSATGMGIGISQERIIFTGGQDPTTVIYPNRLETTHQTVKDSLQIGPFRLFPRTNGNLSLRCLPNS